MVKEEQKGVLVERLRDRSEPRKESQLRTDLLHVAIVDIYCNLKDMTTNFQQFKSGKQAKDRMDIIVNDEEQKRLLRLGNLVLVDYIRSMVDLLGYNIEETHRMIAEITSNIKILRQERLSISNNDKFQRKIGDGKSYDVSRDGELKSFDSYTYEFESKQTSTQNERDLYRVYPAFFNGEDEYSGSTSVLYA